MPFKILSCFCLCRTLVFRVLLINVFLLTFYNEYIVYILKPLTTWPDIKCTFSKCIKLLVVADPQILGEINENILSRYDSDRFIKAWNERIVQYLYFKKLYFLYRYLRNTFSIAFEHVKPDGIIFLGDLTDEGFFADDEQFARYYERFKSIFQLKRMTNSNIPVHILYFLKDLKIRFVNSFFISDGIYPRR